MNPLPDFAEISQIKHLDQRSLRSKKDFQKGEVLSSFSKSARVQQASCLTVQLTEAEHLSLSPECLRYVNHGCRPNTFFDLDALNLVAVEDIRQGDELTFFYPSTEWEMVRPFDCFCNSENCLGRIEGAFSLDPAILKTYRTSRFIAAKAGL
jgi:hypothetical protein